MRANAVHKLLILLSGLGKRRGTQQVEGLRLPDSFSLISCEYEKAEFLLRPKENKRSELVTN